MSIRLSSSCRRIYSIAVRLLILSLFVFIPQSVDASVVINEIRSYGSNDWIELYNTSTQSADLAVYKLEDSTGTLPALNGSISGLGWFSLAVHTRLNNGGDTIKLYKADDSNPVDEISYGEQGGICAPEANQSVGRQPDGSSSIVRFSQTTEKTSNDGIAISSCPTATPTKTPSSTSSPTIPSNPTSTPSPTKLVSNTPSYIKTLTPSKTATHAPSSTPIVSVDQSQLAIITPSPTVPAGMVLGDSTSSNRQMPLLVSLILIGTGFGILAGFYVWNKRRNSVNKSET